MSVDVSDLFVSSKYYHKDCTKTIQNMLTSPQWTNILDHQVFSVLFSIFCILNYNRSRGGTTKHFA